MTDHAILRERIAALVDELRTTLAIRDGLRFAVDPAGLWVNGAGSIRVIRDPNPSRAAIAEVRVTLQPKRFVAWCTCHLLDDILSLPTRPMAHTNHLIECILNNAVARVGVYYGSIDSFLGEMIARFVAVKHPVWRVDPPNRWLEQRYGVRAVAHRIRGGWFVRVWLWVPTPVDDTPKETVLSLRIADDATEAAITAMIAERLNAQALRYVVTGVW